MNQLNETIRVLRIQIEAERQQKQPNWKKIEELSNELADCLEGVDVR